MLNCSMKRLFVGIVALASVSVSGAAHAKEYAGAVYAITN
jgi:hypothetical protein